MLKILLSLFFISVSSVSFSLSVINSEYFDGRWAGVVKESSGEFSVEYLIDSKKNVFYFVSESAGCGGRSTVKASDFDNLKFNEELSFGIKKCSNNGTASLEKSGKDSLKYIWRYKNGSIGAEGILSRMQELNWPKNLAENLVGTWKGTYTCSQGYSGMIVNIPSNDLQNVVWDSFWEEDASGEPYAQTMFNIKIKENGDLDIYPYDWVKHPGNVRGFSNWIMAQARANYDGSSDLNGFISADGCTTFNVRKVQEVDQLVAEIQNTKFVDFEIPFEGNHWRIQESAKKELAKLGKVLLSNELVGGAFELVGHVSGTSGTHKTCIDENHKVVGSSKYAKECWETDADWAVVLSERRANSVKDYLIKNFSVDKNRIKAYGVGNTQHKISDPDNPGNRRVEVKYIKNK
ncbi:MAG TPA: OmpA family protein [Gammaproteobacteria bacterium]|jgi:outer membrane protein OmpA-like peptidoglycan-associated protein|nr:OmpA family protein [Gammaproteobacteria bacterium]